MNNSSIIQCKQLIPGELPFKYRGNALDFEIAAGEIVSVIGSSYAGRSHWLKTICALEDKLSGSVYINGIDAFNLSSKNWVDTRMKVAYLHADTALMSAVNGLINVLIPAQYHQLDKKYKDEILTVKALTILEEIDPKLNLHDLPAYIPKEHRFKIAVARALMLEPEVLVINRPFAHFDNDSKIKFQEFLNNRVKNGLALILATRDIAYALNNSDKIIFAGQDNLYQFYSREEILNCGVPAITDYIKNNS
jgi:ABC-type transporter Mla maintaining outer membrane lipid asymmetry ATPase subunit MlaF